jgi:hypothetical protein
MIYYITPSSSICTCERALFFIYRIPKRGNLCYGFADRRLVRSPENTIIRVDNTSAPRGQRLSYIPGCKLASLVQY